MEDRLWTTAEVSEYLATPVTTLYKWRYQRTGPPSVKIGRNIRYRRQDVDAWVAEQAKEQARESA